MSITHVLVGFVLALCSQPTYAATTIDTGDKAVLQILYNETNGDGWTQNPFNFTSDDCDDFNNAQSTFGAFCNDTTGRVIDLFLHFNNLTGAIPNSLDNLIELQRLRFHGNDLTSTIPNSFCNLIELQELDLSDNCLTGDIPNCLGSLIELNGLWLDGNDLTSTIPNSLGNLGLIYLHLYDNDLTGAIPNSLANLTGLLSLRLEGNCFSCPHPEDVVDLCAGLAPGCDLGDCGDCCKSDLPASPVDENNCTTSSCTGIGCDGCPISCGNSTVILTCFNSVWRGPIEEGYMCIQEDPCEPNPCFNGGSCVNDTDGFHCICEDGFVGDVCETNIVCADITCLNGGTHYDSHVESRCCCCAPGYSGTRCENGEGLNICDSKPCLNGGTCSNDNTAEDKDFTCGCKDGYEGNTCEIDIDECADNPCLNDGVCHDQNSYFSCCCKGGFAGDNCELEPCKQPYYIDPFGKTVKREMDNCADSDLNKAKKERYDKLIAERRNEERYATLTHVASIAGPTLVGCAIGLTFMKLLGRL